MLKVLFDNFTEADSDLTTGRVKLCFTEFIGWPSTQYIHADSAHICSPHKQSGSSSVIKSSSKVINKTVESPRNKKI